jgi:hypothetical protein
LITRALESKSLSLSPPSHSRKFSLLDAMILVAAAAIWLTLTRHFAFAATKSNFDSIWYLGNYGWIGILRHQIGLLLWVLSLTVIALRLRSPRPSRRRLWSQPGFSACVAAVLGVFLQALETGIGRHAQLTGWVKWDHFWMAFLWVEWPYAGPAVAGAWLALAWSRRWRAEPSMVDRLGRLIGICWLIQYFIAEGQFGRWIQIVGRLIERGGR